MVVEKEEQEMGAQGEDVAVKKEEDEEDLKMEVEGETEEDRGTNDVSRVMRGVCVEKV